MKQRPWSTSAAGTLWSMLIVLLCWASACSSPTDAQCLQSAECESDQCVAGVCIPVSAVDGGVDCELPDAVLDTADDGADIPNDEGGDQDVDATPDAPSSDLANDPAPDPVDDPTLDPAVNPDPDTTPTGPNACGGSAILLLDGSPGLPQAPCGATGSGFVACNGVDALLCVGEPPVNACGGAGVLRATPGDGCGCGGVWTCREGGVVCAGGSERNSCGGCASLIAQPGYSCTVPGGIGGEWQCAGQDAVTCGTGNACGGTTTLEPDGARPGEACDATCGPGVWACEGAESLVCRPNLPCNSCGGGTSLAGNPTEACGIFGDGTWACDGTDGVVCEGATTPNVCGGSAVLTAQPGETCGEGGQYLCVGDELRCQTVADPVDRNACGGTSILDAEPSTPCGACGAGLWQCVDTNTVACTIPDDAQRNACGGCGGLVGDVNLACGVCGDGGLACDTESAALVCEDAVQTPNACGGCGPLAGAVGDDCGPCGQYACNTDARRLVCIPRPVGACALTCADINETCTVASRTCVAGAEGVDATCGNCLPGYEELGGNCLSPIPAPTGVVASDGTSAAHVTVTWEEVEGATGYLVFRDGAQITPTAVTATSYNDTGAPAGGTPPTVTGVAATNDRTGDVQVTWTASTPPVGATQTYTVVTLAGEQQSVASTSDTGFRAAQPITGYEVELRDTWTAAGTDTSYTDSAAPAGTITVGAPTATTDRTDGIQVTLVSPSTTAGASQTYRVRAENAAGSSAPSASASGSRSVGTPTVQWQRSTTESGTYTDVDSATSAAYLDASMSAGEERWYRVVVSAVGAVSATTTAVVGRRAEPVVLGGACSEDGQCPTDAWCPTDTTERRCSPRPEVAAGVQMPFQYVPAGSFTMGSPSGEVGRFTTESQVSVTLTRNFFVQRTELTQGQWMALSGGTNPACFRSTTGTLCTTANVNPNGPVELVSWWSVLGYANALSVSLGLPACYTIPSTGCIGTWQAGTLSCGGAMPTVAGGNVYTCAGYRLLTEAEWEYAARAGTTTATYAGNLSGMVNDCSTAQANLDGIAWWCRNSGSRTQAVGGKTPSGWGLYDMLGNVWEWTWDRWDSSANLLGGTDPRSEASGSDRVRRGGSYSRNAQIARAAHRNSFSPGYRYDYLGVRLARTGP